MIYVMLWKFFWNHQKYHAMENHTMENHVIQGITVLYFGGVTHMKMCTLFFFEKNQT